MQATGAMRAKGLHLGVGHEKRFERPIMEIRRLVREGSLGRILQIEGNFNHDKLIGLTSDNWRLSANEALAGPLTATGIHLVDLAVSLRHLPFVPMLHSLTAP
jgi:predicted dehydrogenase